MDAEDALARAMLKAFEKLPAHVNAIVSLRAWLTTFTHNVCIDIHRERARSGYRVENIEHAESAVAAIETDADSPEGALVQQEQRAQLLDALKALPSKLREPFILRFVHEMDYEDIAVQLNLTPANVRKRIQQAREKLRKTLKRPE